MFPVDEISVTATPVVPAADEQPRPTRLRSMGSAEQSPPWRCHRADIENVISDDSVESTRYRTVPATDSPNRIAVTRVAQPFAAAASVAAAPVR
jgi:hypothetical protein